LKALESEEWKQDRYTLKSQDDSFCCLGVVCELYIRKYKKGEWIELETGTDPAEISFRLEEDTYTEYLPDSLTKSLGLTESQVKELARCNDQSRMSFKEIANVIKNMRIYEQ